MFSQDSSSTSLQNFILLHSSHNRPIVLVTSGGTQTQLEKNAVRYIDNFSTGYRGSISTEHFLQKGYAVLHLWRQGSSSPFTHTLNKKLGLKYNEAFNYSCMDLLLDLSRDDNQDDANDVDYPRLHPRLVYDAEIRKMIRERNRVYDSGLLHTIPFVTIDEYLEKLQCCCESLQNYGPMVLIYLAAAVSDYWIPPDQRSTHKISTVNESLTLNLQPVPKKIRCIRDTWCPKAFVISFKLETDEAILDTKAYNAILKYGSHCVIANLLHTRHDVVYIITPNSQTEKKYSKLEIHNKETKSMEEQLVENVIEKHLEYISNETPYVFNAMEQMDYKRKEISNALFWSKVRSWTWEIVGTGVGMLISYYVSGFIRRRIEGHR